MNYRIDGNSAAARTSLVSAQSNAGSVRSRISRTRYNGGTSSSCIVEQSEVPDKYFRRAMAQAKFQSGVS